MNQEIHTLLQMSHTRMKKQWPSWAAGNGWAPDDIPTELASLSSDEVRTLFPHIAITSYLILVMTDHYLLHLTVHIHYLYNVVPRHINDLWKQLLTSLEEDLDPLVQQYVNQELYEDIIKSNCCSYPSTASTNSPLTPDEENIVRYASGYVPMVLMKRHERNVSEKSASFVECLSAMAVNGEESTIL